MNTILFDLDGTLLPMDQEKFMELYLRLLTTHFLPYMPPDLFRNRLFEGTDRMLKNEGCEVSNEKVFYETFFRDHEENAEKMMEAFFAFYENDFDQVQSSTRRNESMIHAVETLRSKGYQLAVATNPLFPLMAVKKRIRWAGLLPEHFQLITSFESMHACKPNPDFYAEVLQMLGAKPQQTLMVGNDAREDLAAGTLGIRTYLVTDCLLQENRMINKPDHQGSSDDFLVFVQKLPALCGKENDGE